MSAVASTLRFTPTAAPSGIPTMIALRCDACRGNFRSVDRDATCPTCGGPSVLASEPLPPAPAHVAHAPSLLVERDPALAQLIERQRVLPAEIRGCETRLVDLRAKAKALAERLSELRVKASVGLAKDRDVGRANSELAECENDVVAAETDLDELVMTSRFLAEAISSRIVEGQKVVAEEAITAARRFAHEISVHLDALALAAADADALGARFDAALADAPVDCRGAVGVLRRLARVTSRSRRESVLDAIANFRTLVARLG